MIMETQNQQPAVNVYPNGNGGGFGDMFGGMGGGAIFFWLILFFFMMMFMGWGNNGNASGNGGVQYGGCHQRHRQSQHSDTGRLLQRGGVPV